MLTRRDGHDRNSVRQLIRVSDSGAFTKSADHDLGATFAVGGGEVTGFGVGAGSASAVLGEGGSTGAGAGSIIAGGRSWGGEMTSSVGGGSGGAVNSCDGFRA